MGYHLVSFAKFVCRTIQRESMRQNFNTYETTVSSVVDK
ncbi:hypothetical protein BSIN_2146 [Burkholderia singularis]|uniref:Uncharacterized protein n=1 Tax=Burkholderia singularis TaxID=1503053 RepID=A0A238H138_9BURK|nr:hypothetical protein BSIN_2146 [Burkholderia singularis]